MPSPETNPQDEDKPGRCALNGFHHPYTGLATVMSEEDSDHQIAFIRDIVRHLNPRGPIEIHYARTFALDNWRLTRIKTVEENLFAYGQIMHRDFRHQIPEVEMAIGHARSFSLYHRAIDKISQYESRLIRNIERIRDLLRKEQADRPLASTVKPAAEPLTRAATSAATAEDRKDPIQ